MGAHSHDNIDWDAHLERLRAADDFLAPEIAEVVRRLLLPGDRSVIEIGAGAGGTAAIFVESLAGNGAGAQLTIVDTAEQLLTAAGERASDAADGVAVHTVRADAAADTLAEEIEQAGASPQADLVYAAFVVHHLPDQLAGLRRLASLVKPGGRLAIVEFGLQTRVLPADVGLAEPGLEARLLNAREQWFQQMRAEMEGSVRLPVGWPKAMAQAGLVDTTSFSYLVDRPAPMDESGRAAALRHLAMLRRDAEERVPAEDVSALDQLLDPDSDHYAAHRDDLSYLSASTIHVGTRPA
ncbi:class I SAM-dependent methyltransferase [Saccharopolyspora rhizosphaerae]|uniref:Class I SAM-dependent methyltransferase n=1 Tax=Saccharopolyspora rhizosphaerae TaxID=2492662 RepID=A0A3R8Q039_9PSEU|nr:class I SAM-dependent methyltransferase [Saccharopolyspora rhizosphaerae]RRO15626.1 class I SAM-dependent methyltransferase [Saccharopolyspora rhizosphaerae]